MSDKYSYFIQKVIGYIYIFINEFIIYKSAKFIKKDEGIDDTPIVENELIIDYQPSYIKSYKSMSTIVFDSSSEEDESKSNSVCNFIQTSISSFKSMFTLSSNGSAKSQSSNKRLELNRNYSPSFDRFQMLNDEFLLKNDTDTPNYYCPSCGIELDTYRKSFYYSDHQICQTCYKVIIDKIKVSSRKL